MDWPLFWTAASAIGTVFVGIVAIGITIWQTYMQYRRKIVIRVQFTCVITNPYTSTKHEMIDGMSVEIINYGNMPNSLTQLYLIKPKEKDSIYIFPPKQSEVEQIANKKGTIPSEILSRQRISFFRETSHIIDRYGITTETKLQACVRDSSGKQYKSKVFTLSTLKSSAASLPPE